MDNKKLAEKTIVYLGLELNIINVDACLTRLRVTLHDNSKIDNESLKSLGAKDIIITESGIQLIFGIHSQEICKNIREILADNAIIVERILTIIGHKENIKTIDACLTRLRISVYDSSKINKKEIDTLGFKALTDGNNIQIILGNDSNDIKNKILKLL